MLVIHPDECIDCGLCVPECPANAILPGTEPGLSQWLALNATYARQWPNIARKGQVPPDADAFNGLPDKFKLYFSPKPGRENR